MYDYRRRGARDTVSTDGKYAIGRAAGPCLYAVRMPDGLIKIGYSGDVMDRIRSHRCLDSILVIRSGTFEEEQAVHRRLKPFRARGREYYHPVPSVIGVVNELRAAVNLDPLPH